MYTKHQTTAASNILQLLQLKAAAINRTIEKLDREQIDRSIQILHGCQGKAIAIGVGKSALIARKIAATLTSIGIPAIYLHPGDDLHDFGIVTQDDVVIMLSNSGEDELLTMIPHLKLRSVPIVGILGNAESRIARELDVVLDVSVLGQADPLNSTISTTVALAVGEALATTLVQMKDMTPDAFNHPADRLSKGLIKVGDLMHSDEYLKVSLDTQWTDVVCAMTQGGFGAVNVIDGVGRLLGVITDSDLRQWVMKVHASYLYSLVAKDMMTLNPLVVTAQTLADEAIALMAKESQISTLPVVDEDLKSIGLICLQDLVRSRL